MYEEDIFEEELDEEAVSAKEARDKATPSESNPWEFQKTENPSKQKDNPYQQNSYQQQYNYQQQNRYQQPQNRYQQARSENPYGDTAPRYGNSMLYNAEGKRIGSAPARISLVCGVLALLQFMMGINIILAIVAIVTGINYLTKYERKSRSSAIIGIVTAVLSIVVMIGSYVYIFQNDNLYHMFEYDITQNDEAPFSFYFDYDYGTIEKEPSGFFSDGNAI
ncbi:MAG: DUF308 domain-containing protein [Pseudobutyrivibrio sp.]|nr:DUF308 domain-containing protein [Pseudobutyrivibrio sp.]